MPRWALLLGILLWGFAQAATVEVTGGDSLEVRNATLPGGAELEYFVVTGSPVTITIDGADQIIAEHLEIDTTNNVIRIIGYGAIRAGEQETQGRDLTYSLEDETFRGEDVLIVTEALDVVGADANRVPGQISVVTGRFSPCSRCEQQVEDYGFRAERLELFPGDRLVAFQVQVLIKGVPVFFLPLLVLPLGPPDRQPNFSIESGDLNERAEVSLTWPYVAASALGTVTLNYFADVLPGQGNFVSNTFLGGQPEVNYLGFELNYRFYTEAGQGNFIVGYQPGFISYLTDAQTETGRRPVDKEEPEYRVRFDYLTDAQRSGVNTRFEVDRDDAATPDVTTFELELAETIEGWAVTLLGEGFIDAEPEEDRSPFAFERRALSLNIQPEGAEAGSYRAGPFSLSGLRLNLGVFQAVANQSNRSAVLEESAPPGEGDLRVVTAGRVLESHSVTLDPVRPWAGLSVSGFSNFNGQYYSTRNPNLEDEAGEFERFINWNTGVNLTQNFGERGSLSLLFVRDINEGETPFSFDNLRLGNQTYLQGNLALRPFNWLSLSSGSRFVFVDNRSDLTGFDPVTSSLRLFDNLSWISLEFSNTYDLRGDISLPESERRADPGELRTSLTLSSPEPDLQASLNLTYIDDLNPAPDRVTNERVDGSELDISYTFGLPPYFLLDASLGYRSDPPQSFEENGVREVFDPFVLGVTLGTADQSDRVPGFRLGFERDLNRNETSELQLEFTAAVEPVELRLRQDISVQDGRLDEATYGVIWRGVAEFQARGFALLPPSWLGIELDEERQQSLVYELVENRENGNARWRVSYLATRVFTAGDAKLTQPRLEAFIDIDPTRLGDLTFYIDFDAQLNFREEENTRNFSVTHLSRANLNFYLDVYERVGIQARALRYEATASEGKLASANLSLDDLAFTVRLFDEFYVSSVFNDVWEFGGSDPDGFNFQPELRLIWNRCCWALYSSWDTVTGDISIRLTASGADETFGDTFETGLRLPGDNTASTRQP